MLQDIADGDEQAFASLVVHYGPQLEKAVFQVIRTELAVKDIVQDVFLQIWLDREKLPGLAEPRTWFFRIAYYRSYAWLRHQGVRERGREVILTQHGAASSRSETEERTLLAETRKLLNEAIRQLPPRAREIYLLSREEQLRPAEIAQRLGLSTQTVKNSLSLALAQLRDRLSQHGILLPAILLLMHR